MKGNHIHIKSANACHALSENFKVQASQLFALYHKITVMRRCLFAVLIFFRSCLAYFSIIFCAGA